MLATEQINVKSYNIDTNAFLVLALAFWCAGCGMSEDSQSQVKAICQDFFSAYSNPDVIEDSIYLPGLMMDHYGPGIVAVMFGIKTPVEALKKCEQ